MMWTAASACILTGLHACWCSAPDTDTPCSPAVAAMPACLPLQREQQIADKARLKEAKKVRGSQAGRRRRQQLLALFVLCGGTSAGGTTAAPGRLLTDCPLPALPVCAPAEAAQPREARLLQAQPPRPAGHEVPHGEDAGGADGRKGRRQRPQQTLTDGRMRVGFGGGACTSMSS